MSEQKSSKRPSFPLVLTGNDLLSGEAVWFDGAGWTARPEGALIATDEAGAVRFEAILSGSEREIVEPYLITVALSDRGTPVQAHYREKIRAIGPTFALAGAI